MSLLHRYMLPKAFKGGQHFYYGFYGFNFISRRRRTCSTQAEMPKVAVPLCFNTSIVKESLKNVVMFYQSALDTNAQTNNCFTTDGGPTCDDLNRELNWLMEDAVQVAICNYTLSITYKGRRILSSEPFSSSSPIVPLLNRLRRLPSFISYRHPTPFSDSKVLNVNDGEKSPEPWIVELRVPGVEALKELWIQRIQKRVPLQYLVNAAPFGDLVLAVGPGVLIPRPETEALPALVLSAVQRFPDLVSDPWVDLGTGSGAVALGVADTVSRWRRGLQEGGRGRGIGTGEVDERENERDHCRESPNEFDKLSNNQGANPPTTSTTVVGERKDGKFVIWAADQSETSLAYASWNAQRLGFLEEGKKLNVKQFPLNRYSRIQIAPRGSWFEALDPGTFRGKLGGIVSNPPYIETEVVQQLQAEVRQHEPIEALDGGLAEGGGMDCLKDICHGASDYLRPGGFLALETGGSQQAETLREFLSKMRGENRQLCFKEVETHPDCFDVIRFVTCYRNNDG